MRNIKSFTVTKTDKLFTEIIEEGDKIGFIYPQPHLYIFKHDLNDPQEEWKHIKSRPLSAPCATVKEGYHSKYSVGIMIYCQNGEVEFGAEQLAANLIQLIADDLGIINFNILTDEINDEKAIDVLSMNTAVGKALSIFRKRI